MCTLQSHLYTYQRIMTHVWVRHGGTHVKGKHECVMAHMCMCVCMFKYVYTYTCMCICVYKYIFIYVHIYECMCICIYIYIYMMYIYVYVYMYAYTYICIYTYIYTCVYIHMKIYTRTCIYIYIYTSICIYKYVTATWMSYCCCLCWRDCRASWPFLIFSKSQLCNDGPKHGKLSSKPNFQGFLSLPRILTLFTISQNSKR